MGNWKENKAVAVVAGIVLVITAVLIVKGLTGSKKAGVTPMVEDKAQAEEAKLQKGGR